MNYEEDLRALAESAERAGKDLHDNELEIQDLRAQIKEAEEGNQALRAAGQQFDFLARDIEKGQDDDFLILSKGLLQSMVPLAQKLSVLLHAGGFSRISRTLALMTLSRRYAGSSRSCSAAATSSRLLSRKPGRLRGAVR